MWIFVFWKRWDKSGTWRGLGDSAPSLLTIKYWIGEFKRSRTSIFDEKCPGHPNEDSSSKMIEKIHVIVINDREVKVHGIAEAVCIPIENILTNHLDMRKLSTRWVPRLLTINHKECLASNPNDFWRWLTKYGFITAHQSPEWVFRGKSVPKEPRWQSDGHSVLGCTQYNLRRLPWKC